VSGVIWCNGMSEKHTTAEDETQPSERAAENIAAWEKKRAAQRPPGGRDEPSDDAEAGGP
jgi:hypothetical protein